MKRNDPRFAEDDQTLTIGNMPFVLRYLHFKQLIIYENDKIKMKLEAGAVGTVFSTKASLLLGAAKNRAVKDAKPRFYATFEMPDGVKLANIPGFKGIPNIDQLPVLGESTKIAYSNFDGIAASMSPASVLGDIDAAKVALLVERARHGAVIERVAKGDIVDGDADQQHG